MMRAAILSVTCILGLGVCQNLRHLGMTVRQVHVDGARLLPASVLDEITGSALGRPMSADTRDELRGRFEAHWLVERAEIRRQWPRSIIVRLTERRVMARCAGQPPVVIDESGVSWTHEGIPAMLPMLQGWTQQDSDAWRPAIQAMECLATAPQMWAGSIVEAPPRNRSIHVVCPNEGIRLRLPCPPDEGLIHRVAYLPTVIADVRARGGKAALVDLRWVNQIVVAEAAE
ncbi:FtsQ-type POTRA domain-containing protein [Candidatus Fermentibacteria bacterium]|nr:FtsQ-type POTRA domain-containing protein [Candidatus Fermentibacteria bacterium]